MKEVGQSMLRGGILIIGFLILVFVLTSLPGGKSAAGNAAEAPTQAAPVPSGTPVPSAIRGAQPPAPSPGPSASAASGSAQRRRAEAPQPSESQAQMEDRIRRYLDR